MIFDTLQQSAQYQTLHAGFAPAFDFLRTAKLATFYPGRKAIDEERLQLVVVRDEGKGREGVRFESHRRYIDIQYSLAGSDLIGWNPVAECSPDPSGYDADKDVQFYTNQPKLWIPCPAGHFVVFFPTDAHAPMGGTGLIHKIVVKVAVDWQ